MYKKLAVGSVGTLLLLSPLFASAQAVSTQSQIDALLAQIKQLQALIAQLKPVQIGLVVKDTDVLFGPIGDAGKRDEVAAPPRSIIASFYGHFDIGSGIPAWNSGGKPYVSFGDGTTDVLAPKMVCPDAPGVDIGCQFEASHTYASDGTYTVTVYTLGQTSNGDDGRAGTKRTLARKTITVSSGPAGDPSPCLTLRNTLTLGSTDANTAGEVSKLQTFLMSQGTVNDPIYPERLVTGYFGPATSRAVQKWQSAHGIALTTVGVAVVGPKTRAAMQGLCSMKPSPTVLKPEKDVPIGMYQRPATISPAETNTITVSEPVFGQGVVIDPSSEHIPQVVKDFAFRADIQTGNVMRLTFVNEDVLRSFSYRGVHPAVGLDRYAGGTVYVTCSAGPFTAQGVGPKLNKVGAVGIVNKSFSWTCNPGAVGLITASGEDVPVGSWAIN